MQRDSYVPKINPIDLDADYQLWLTDLKTRYHKAQIKAAVKVNSEKLLWNWQLGRDLVQRRAEERWGAHIVEQLSFDLQSAFPSEKGFATSNLWYMKKWFLFYTQDNTFDILHQLGGENLWQQENAIEKLHQRGGEILERENDFPFPPIFAYVPWRHHTEIITKCKSVDEALYYIRKTIEGNWSRNYLLERIKDDDYHRRCEITNNFDLYLPSPQSMLAKEVIKDNLDFGFVALPENYDEHMLEDELYKHMTRFLLELGTGFAFIGRQKEIVVSGVERRIDLLLYHIRLRSYVVLDLLCCAQHKRSYVA